MNDASAKYRLKLKANNISNTRPRKAVFMALLQSGHQPLSINELVDICKHQADRASVYRSIDALQKTKIIKRIYHGWKYRLELSDEFHGHHHHLTCYECSEIIAIPENENIEKLLKELEQSKNYKITEHHLEIKGICLRCQKKMEPRARSRF